MADWTGVLVAVEAAGKEAKITGFWALVGACVDEIGTKAVVAVGT